MNQLIDTLIILTLIAFTYGGYLTGRTAGAKQEQERQDIAKQIQRDLDMHLEEGMFHTHDEHGRVTGVGSINR